MWPIYSYMAKACSDDIQTFDQFSRSKLAKGMRASVRLKFVISISIYAYNYDFSSPQKKLANLFKLVILVFFSFSLIYFPAMSVIALSIVSSNNDKGKQQMHLPTEPA